MGWDFLPVSALRGVVDLAVRLVELGGAAVILAGGRVGVRAVGRIRRGPDARRESIAAAAYGFNRIRLTLGTFLALGLEFQLAGDILRTAIAPSFTRSASWPRSPRSGPRSVPAPLRTV